MSREVARQSKVIPATNLLALALGAAAFAVVAIGAMAIGRARGRPPSGQEGALQCARS